MQVTIILIEYAIVLTHNLYLLKKLILDACNMSSVITIALTVALPDQVNK